MRWSRGRIQSFRCSARLHDDGALSPCRAGPGGGIKQEGWTGCERRGKRERRRRGVEVDDGSVKKHQFHSTPQEETPAEIQAFCSLGAQPPRKHTLLCVSYLESCATRAPSVPETGGFRLFRGGKCRLGRIPAALCIGNAANFRSRTGA